MDARLGIYDVADLARPESEGGFFKLLLHLASTKKTTAHGSIIDHRIVDRQHEEDIHLQIAILPCTGAIRLCKSKLAQGNLS